MTDTEEYQRVVRLLGATYERDKLSKVLSCVALRCVQTLTRARRCSNMATRSANA